MHPDLQQSCYNEERNCVEQNQLTTKIEMYLNQSMYQKTSTRYLWHVL